MTNKGDGTIIKTTKTREKSETSRRRVQWEQDNFQKESMIKNSNFSESEGEGFIINLRKRGTDHQKLKYSAFVKHRGKKENKVQVEETMLKNR